MYRYRTLETWYTGNDWRLNVDAHCKAKDADDTSMIKTQNNKSLTITGKIVEQFKAFELIACVAYELNGHVALRCGYWCKYLFATVCP